jgi:hypothetical protein
MPEMQNTGRAYMMTPALVVDGEVKVVGKVPNMDQIKSYIS